MNYKEESLIVSVEDFQGSSKGIKLQMDSFRILRVSSFGVELARLTKGCISSSDWNTERNKSSE